MILEKMTNYTVTASYILEVEINCFGVVYINMYDSNEANINTIQPSSLIGAKIILFEDNDPSLTRKHMPAT